MVRTVLAFAAAALIGLSACSSSRPASATPPRSMIASTGTSTAPAAVEVPWTDRPAPRGATLSRPIPIADARRCTGEDLSVTLESSQGAGQTTLVIVYDLKNVSGTTCSVGGFASSVVATEPGLPAVTATRTRFKQDPPAGNIAPGRIGILVLYASLCGGIEPSPPATRPARTYHRLVVALPGGGQTVANTTLDLSCGGFSVDPLGVRERVFRAWYSPLQIAVSIPATVDAGTTMSYAVTVTNPTADPIRIKPCPGYIETATGTNINLVETHVLNCDQVRELPASGRVRYRMRMKIPATTPTGAAVVSWTFAAPESPLGVTKLLDIRGSEADA